MYVRFQTSVRDKYSFQPQGVFQLTYSLRDEGVFLGYDKEYVKELLSWFDENLNEPKKFSRKTIRSSYTKGISWCKDSAKEHLSKMHELKALLENYNVFVEVVMTEAPGYIIYEDEFQIVAEMMA